MVEQHNCSFCGGLIEPGTGKMFVKRDGTIFWFCSTKCQNNQKLGRVPRRVLWTAAAKKATGKE
ncbi:MAG TPA: 50S ribosomal protein L24e [Bacteroidota bacterium]|nr:50S ribosomal protein L24e [Bacteroidota bacterium]